MSQPKNYTFFFEEQTPHILYGVDSIKVQPSKFNANHNYCYIGKDWNVPTIDLTKTTKKAGFELFLQLQAGLVKTKEFYAKNPPTQNNKVQVIETTVTENNGKYQVKQLTDKYFHGFVGDNICISLPFDMEKNILIPKAEANFHDNENGSFNIEWTKANQYETIDIQLDKMQNIKVFDLRTKLIPSKQKASISNNTQQLPKVDEVCATAEVKLER